MTGELVPAEWPHFPNDRDECKIEGGSTLVCEFGCIGCVVPHFKNLALRVLAPEDQVVKMSAANPNPTSAGEKD